MIEIMYYRAEHRVKIKGHASSAEYGKDLICAAVTMLCRTLAADCINMGSDMRIKEVSAKLRPGEADISIRPQKKLRSVVTLVFDSVCTGFEILSRQYPEYVSYRIF